MQYNFFVRYEDKDRLYIHGYPTQRIAFEYYEEAVALRFNNVEWYERRR